MAKHNIIALVDCDSFFVSVEQALNPDLKNKPVCVLSNNDGCIISRSKEAKKIGVKMGMPYFLAKQIFKNCHYISSKIDNYREFSAKIMEILKNFSPDVEIYSIDEAFIDLTGTKKLYNKNYLEIAKMIKQEIWEKVKIPVSIGLSSSKVLAKLASDKAKDTDGLYLIGACKIKKELQHTKIDKIWGIGAGTGKALNKYGIITAEELVAKSDDWLKSTINIKAVELKHELLGEMISKVSSKVKLPKSIQQTRAFKQFTSDKNYIINELNQHIHTACVKLRQIQGTCSSITVMLRTKDFQVFQEKKSLLKSSDFELEISNISRELLDKIYMQNITYRSTGIILEKFSFNNNEQLFLFSNTEKDLKTKKLIQSIDNIETKYGKNAIKTGFKEV